MIFVLVIPMELPNAGNPKKMLYLYNLWSDFHEILTVNIAKPVLSLNISQIKF
jgi:hypothetical protein